MRSLRSRSLSVLSPLAVTAAAAGALAVATPAGAATWCWLATDDNAARRRLDAAQ